MANGIQLWTLKSPRVLRRLVTAACPQSLKGPLKALDRGLGRKGLFPIHSQLQCLAQSDSRWALGYGNQLLTQGKEQPLPFYCLVRLYAKEAWSKESRAGHPGDVSRPDVLRGGAVLGAHSSPVKAQTVIAAGRGLPAA